MDNNITENNEIKKSENIKILIIFLIISIFIAFIFFFLSAPIGSKDNIIHIDVGQSTESLSIELIDKNIVRNKTVLKLLIKILSSGKGIISGDYLIEKNSPVWVVALQIGRGVHNIKPLKITIREGLTNEEIATLLSDKLKLFNKDEFLINTSDKQGYLFPDTYFIYGMDTEKDLIDKLTINFQSKIKNINSLINSSGKTLSDIIIMASILEGEASGQEDIGIISGILWKRISLGMPLQVDVDKSTYDTKGLPLKPVNNPGLSSIKAAISPISSKYLYYIHDKNGKVHYAETFEEHKKNIAIYLK